MAWSGVVCELSCVEFSLLASVGLLRHTFQSSSRVKRASKVSRVGSSQEVFEIWRVGSGRPDPPRPDPIRPVRFDRTRQQPWYFSCCVITSTMHRIRCCLTSVSCGSDDVQSWLTTGGIESIRRASRVAEERVKVATTFC